MKIHESDTEKRDPIILLTGRTWGEYILAIKFVEHVLFTECTTFLWSGLSESQS